MEPTTFSPAGAGGPSVPASEGPRICYALVSAAYGVGQFTEVLGLLRSAPGGSRGSLVTRQIDPLAARELADTNLCLVRRYWMSPVSAPLRSFLRRSELVFVKSGLPFLLASSRAQLPTVYVLHQPDPPELFSGWARLNRQLAAIAERPALLGRATALVSVAPWVRDWYWEHFGLDSQVIPDSFDFASPLPAPPAVGPGPRLLSVGDWDGVRGRKRTHELLEGLPEIRRQLPGTTLTLVGLAPVARGALQHRARALGLDGAAQVLGKVERSELDQLYRAADIYVTASVCEGFYRPIIESFHAGCPAVVRDPTGVVDPVCQGAAQHVRQSKAGALYDGSGADLARAVEAVYGARTSLAPRAVEYSNRFERSAITPLYVRLFDQVLGHG